MKQFRAHLDIVSNRCQFKPEATSLPILFCSYTGTGNLKEAIRTVVSADLYHNTSITSDCITFFTEIETV